VPLSLRGEDFLLGEGDLGELLRLLELERGLLDFSFFLRLSWEDGLGEDRLGFFLSGSLLLSVGLLLPPDPDLPPFTFLSSSPPPDLLLFFPPPLSPELLLRLTLLSTVLDLLLLLLEGFLSTELDLLLPRSSFFLLPPPSRFDLLAPLRGGELSDLFFRLPYSLLLSLLKSINTSSIRKL
jgi:hypothetical protein